MNRNNLDQLNADLFNYYLDYIGKCSSGEIQNPDASILKESREYLKQNNYQIPEFTSLDKLKKAKELGVSIEIENE